MTPRSRNWPMATCARSMPTSPPRRERVRRAGSGNAKEGLMEVIGRAARRLVTLLLLLTLVVACSAPGRAQPTATPGEEPPPEMPTGEPVPETPEPSAVAEVPPEAPPDTPEVPPSAAPTA